MIFCERIDFEELVLREGLGVARSDFKESAIVDY